MRRSGEITSEGFIFSSSFLLCPSWATFVLDNIYVSRWMTDGGVWPEASIDPIHPRIRPLCFLQLGLFMSRTQKGGNNREMLRIVQKRFQVISHAHMFIELSTSRKVSISYCALCLGRTKKNIYVRDGGWDAPLQGAGPQSSMYWNRNILELPANCFFFF